MRRTTIAAVAAAAVIAGGAVAVPAMASGSSPTPTPTSSSAPFKGLTDAQQKELCGFLAVHPKAGTALANRLDTWQRFADAHPAVVAELTKVAGMTPDQRKAELKAWAKAHPADAKAWHEFRQQVRDARKERREARKNS
ncbi:hemophore-related protein [Angustibacter luteus]|uniref:Hemophore-related protein n=1 Tax=Angustibacter luteus TaxID=658456 RepID=A0ABW1JGF2_9ACTN